MILQATGTTTVRVSATVLALPAPCALSGTIQQIQTAPPTGFLYVNTNTFRFGGNVVKMTVQASNKVCVNLLGYLNNNIHTPATAHVTLIGGTGASASATVYDGTGKVIYTCPITKILTNGYITITKS